MNQGQICNMSNSQMEFRDHLQIRFLGSNSICFFHLKYTCDFQNWIIKLSVRNYIILDKYSLYSSF